MTPELSLPVPSLLTTAYGSTPSAPLSRVPSTSALHMLLSCSLGDLETSRHLSAQ